MSAVVDLFGPAAQAVGQSLGAATRGALGAPPVTAAPASTESPPPLQLLPLDLGMSPLRARDEHRASVEDLMEARAAYQRAMAPTPLGEAALVVGAGALVGWVGASIALGERRR